MKTNCRRILLRIAVYSMLGLFVSASALAIPSYTITDLGTLGGETSIARGVNHSGQVVGYSLTADENSISMEAFLYSGDTMVGLGTLGGERSEAAGINNLGQVVGQSMLEIHTPQPFSSDYRAFLFSDNMMSEIPTPWNNYSYAIDINDFGQVAMYAMTDTGFVNAFLYDNGNLINLGTLGGETSVASGINNLGQVVGQSTISSYGYGHAFLYKDGTMVDLGTLGGEAPNPTGESSYGKDINDSGEVAGWGYTADGVIHAFIYSDGIKHDLDTLGGDHSQAFGINNLGEAVGHAQLAGDDGYRAFFYTHGFMYDLTTLVSGDFSWDYLASANDINDKGQIVGWGRINGESHAFLMTPIPEITIDVILEFFNASVDDGTLEGRGRGWIVKIRLGLMRQLLVIAGEFIEHDRINATCFMLKRAHKRCDEESPPPDFVEGLATEELAEMILELMENLECE